MSTLKYMHMNQTWPQQFSYYCFGTKKTNLLSKQQLVTRLYKTFLHRIQELHFQEKFGDLYEQYTEQVRIARKDFEVLLNLDRTEPQFEHLLNKYLDYLEENYDSNQTFFINQPYAPDHNKLLLFDEKDFLHDPYGFYSSKNVYYDQQTYGVPFYEDYPISSYQFKDLQEYKILESFPEENK